MNTRPLFGPIGLAAAAALMAAAPSQVQAQGTTREPKVSSRSSDSAPRASSTLSVIFDAPVEAAPKMAGPEPESTTPRVDHLAPDHACSTGDAGVDAIVREEAARTGVDACFVVAVMRQESSFSRWAVSPKGACGYMQLMPETARRFGAADVFDPRQNISAGVRYLRFLLDRFGGSLELALAGYNAGEGAVERYGNRIPPYSETQNYVRVIASRYLAVHSGQTRGMTATAPPPAAPARPADSLRISVDFDEPEAKEN